MEPSSRVEKFVDAVEYVDDWLEKSEEELDQEELEKSLIQALTRTLKSGKKIFVREHTNKVVKNPKSDEENAATLSSLGAAAKKAGPVKPQKSVKQILKDATTERLQQLRYKLGGATHKTLLTSYKGKPLHFWLASVENELGLRTAAAH